VALCLSFSCHLSVLDTDFQGKKMKMYRERERVKGGRYGERERMSRGDQ
jgi:hypothetical protein